jgi:hypothetical protein
MVVDIVAEVQLPVVVGGGGDGVSRALGKGVNNKEWRVSDV